VRLRLGEGVAFRRALNVASGTETAKVELGIDWIATFPELVGVQNTAMATVT
jgi:hypothetical protein